MPKEAKSSVPVSAFGRLAVKSNTSIDTSGRGMPVNTRSMQRLSSTPLGSSGQIRPGVSRGTPQYSISQSAMNTVGGSNDNVESSDEDTESDDDSGEEGGAENDGSDADSDDSDDENDPESEVRKIFAIAEPSGLVPSELEDDEPGMNEAQSRVYRRLLNVVAAEAASNERFLDNLKAAVRDGERALLMYFQMRTRLEAIMLRFDQDPRKNDAINTATRLRSLIKAIGSIIQSDNLKAMDPMTKNQYFGLLLDLLRGVVDRDRPRDSQGSRSPYVTESGRDVSLYQQLKETQEKKHGVMYAAALIGFMFSKLSPHGPDARQMEHVGSMLRAVENRHGLSGIAVFPNSPDPTQALAAQLRKIQAAIKTPIPASSRSSRSS